MAKLIYKLTEPDTLRYSKEANEITFDIDDGLTIDEFKVVCMRLAAAMGYSPNSIKNSFGEIKDTHHDMEDLIKMLNER
jgi:hypothetical protein